MSGHKKVRLHFIKEAGNIFEQEAIQTCWTLISPSRWPPEPWCRPEWHLATRSSAALGTWLHQQGGLVPPGWALLPQCPFKQHPTDLLQVYVTSFVMWVLLLVPGVCSARLSSCTRHLQDAPSALTEADALGNLCWIWLTLRVPWTLGVATRHPASTCSR